MISVLDHIEYLSYKHDCIIVPGLGAFISQKTSVKDNGMISSLRRNIVFNSAVDYNDGLLENSIMRREQINLETARTYISDYVYSLKSQLKHEGEVPLGRLGYFKRVEAEKMEFQPFVSYRTSSEYFGLSALTLKPLSDCEVLTVEVESKKNVNVIPFSKKFIQVAASIVLLIAMSVLLSTPVIEQDNVNYANLNAFSIINTPIEEIQQEDLYIAIPKSSVKNDEEKVEINENKEESSLKQEGNYCIVVASLASKAQAEKFVKESGLIDCEIAKSIKKYRVYVARGTFEEMIELQKVKYSGTDAWVCKI